MSILNSELKFYLSAGMPDDDADTSGGAIDTATKLTDFVLASASVLEIVSSNAGDTTQTATVYGRNAAGVIFNSAVLLNGTTAVDLTGTYERVSRVALSGAAAGTVTLRVDGGGATVCTLEAGITKVQRMFYDSFSAATQKVRYEKAFGKNTNGSLALLTATVTLSADPSGKYKIGLAAAVDDSTSVANRLAAPGGVSFSDDGVAIAVPGADLAAGSAIGTWVQQTLEISDDPTKSTFTLKLEGNTV